MTRRLNIVLFILFAVVAVPYYWLLIDDRPGDARAKPIAIRDLREAATSMAGELPAEIRFDAASARPVPRIVLAAGQGIKRVAVEMRSYAVQYPSQQPILIDGGKTIVEASGFRFERFEQETLERMNATRGKARLVITLGEANARPKSAPPRHRPACARPRAVAPGVVEIPICDKLVAKRLIYVRLANGREYLLTGDIAPTMANIFYQAGPSRLLNDFFVTQDRSAVHSWLLTIERLAQQAPELIIIPGHDRLQFRQMQRGFAES